MVLGPQVKRHKLVISRNWHHPFILYKITDESISCEMHLEDFIHALKKELGDMPEFRDALKKEIGSVALVVRKSTFQKKLDEAFAKVKRAFENELDAAVERILQGIKAESSRAI